MRGVGDAHRDFVTPHAKAGIADAFAAQRTTHFGNQRLKLVFDRGRNIDFEQQIRAASQVEAQIDLLRGQPAGHARQALLRDEIRDRKENAEQTDDADQHDFPAFELKHRYLEEAGLTRRIMKRPR